MTTDDTASAGRASSDGGTGSASGGSVRPHVYDFEHARAAVARHARVTSLLHDPWLSEETGRDVHLKAECLQHTGSFKVRGAASRLEALSDAERARGVVACSSGNHGRAVAYVAGSLGIPATIFVPEWVDPVKLEGIRARGADAVCRGESFDESEALALEMAAKERMAYVSAYDDPYVIAGQGTLADEIIDQLDGAAPAAFVVPMSGGGLVGGIAAALRDRRRDSGDDGSASRQGDGTVDEARRGARGPACLAASAENAAVMLASLRAGHPVELPEEETLANALAGGIGLDNRYSFALVRNLVDAHTTVTEEEIAEAMRYAMARVRLVVEGGGAVGLASLLVGAWSEVDLPDGPLVVVLSGGNVSADTLAGVLRGWPLSSGG